MLSRDEVIAAYRYILGREPESDAVVEANRGHTSVEELRAAFLKSAEFTSLYDILAPPDAPQIAADLLLPDLPIETETSGALRAQMWARVAKNWERLGAEAPHWSVLSSDAYRPERFAENQAAFNASADVDLAIVDAALARLPNAHTLRSGTCLELGCGVGRVTRGLSERFSSVVGIDVSAPHLAAAEAEVKKHGVANVRLRHVRQMDDYWALTGYSFFFSRLVLQHNPPPVQSALLRALIGALTAPGAALFQVITYLQDYAFSAEDYLATEHMGMEMHVLPQQALFDCVIKAGLTVLSFDRDSGAGDLPHYRSHILFAVKT